MCPVIVEFLVKFLEQEVCRLHWDVGFVTSTMQEIGVQLPRLLEVYDQLFKTRVQCITVSVLEEKKFHYIIISMNCIFFELRIKLPFNFFHQPSL